MQIAVRNSFDPPATVQADACVFFDVFRASTTLLTLLDQRPASVVTLNEGALLTSYLKQGFQLVSEVISGGLDNSPTQVRSQDFRNRHVVHRSTNLTEAIIRYPKTCARLFLGSFVNAGALTKFLHDGEFQNIELIAVGQLASKTEMIEDRTCAQYIAEKLRDQDTQPNLGEIFNLIKAKNKADMPFHYWQDLEYALRVDQSQEVGEFFRDQTGAAILVAADHYGPGIRSIPSTATWKIRSIMLRPGKPLTEVQFPGDDDAVTRHFGAFLGDQLVGIATLRQEPYPGTNDPGFWQLRGMATLPEVRGQGFGKKLITACKAYARQRQAQFIWCNARTSALGFYEGLGFTTHSDVFEISDAGPHVVMRSVVNSSKP